MGYAEKKRFDEIPHNSEIVTNIDETKLDDMRERINSKYTVTVDDEDETVVLTLDDPLRTSKDQNLTADK